MRTSTSRLEDSIEFQLKQSLLYLDLQSVVGEEAGCQVCKKTLNEDDHITLYLYRPADQGRYAIGQCRCSDHNEDLTTLFTLGVDELIIDGQVGRGSNHTSQQIWPVLLAPQLRLVSTAATTTAQKITVNCDDSTDPLPVLIPQPNKIPTQHITPTAESPSVGQEAPLQATSNAPSTVTASLPAVLDGQLLPANTPVTCQACGDPLREGSQVIAEQTPPQHTTWQPTAWYCLDCRLKAPHQPHPLLYRVLATVGMRSFSSRQQHQPCLNDPVVLSIDDAVTDSTDCSPEITPSVRKAGINLHTQCHSMSNHPNNPTTPTANPTND